jgi:hypothetical protein
MICTELPFNSWYNDDDEDDDDYGNNNNNKLLNRNITYLRL